MANIHFRHQSPTVDPKLKPIERQIASMGAAVSVADYDNDGWNDIYFTNSRSGSHNALYRNLHNGKFEDLLDILICGYYNEDIDPSNLKTSKMMPESFRYASNGGRKYLLKNIGNWKFKDVTAEYGINSTKWTLAAASADLNGDGYPDLILANDYNVDELYINDKGNAIRATSC